jgi:hypothetical protein
MTQELDATLEEAIRSLELRLLDPEVRAAPEKLEELLADDFLEFGSSGRTYDKREIVDALQSESSFESSVQDFRMRQLGPDAVLATYQVTIRPRLGGDLRRSLRSSVWVRREGRWQLAFHQGTLIP